MEEASMLINKLREEEEPTSNETISSSTTSIMDDRCMEISEYERIVQEKRQQNLMKMQELGIVPIIPEKSKRKRENVEMNGVVLKSML